MFRRCATFFRSFLIALAVLLLVMPSPAMAQTKAWSKTADKPCIAGMSYTSDAGTATFEAATIQGFECLLENILATATTFIGLVAFVMVIVGAFYYLTSGGNSSTLELGKKSITYGIIGIIVALLAYFILVLISDFTGVDRILQFNLNVGP